MMRFLIVALCAWGLVGCTVHRDATRRAAADKAVEMDQDKDGILDSADKCPAEAETMNGYRDGDGCPDVVPAKPAFRKIQYAANTKAMIPDGSKEILDEVGMTLTRYPELMIRVETRTDSYGAESYNVELSSRRAEAAKAYLMKQYGIDSHRVESVGYGSSRPVASLDTKDGRAANRSSEFVIVSGWPPKE